MDDHLHISERVYSKIGSPRVFRVPLDEIGDVRFVDVPFYSTLSVEDLPGDAESYALDINFTHAGGSHNESFFLNCHVNFWQPGAADDPAVTAACNRRLRHIKRTFRDFVQSHAISDGDGETPRSRFEGKWLCGVLYSKDFTRADNPRLADFVDPLVERFHRLITTPDRLLFLCHASEDKAFVDRLAAYLDSCDVPIWYDKREIGLGDSIVTQINAGLGAASHVVVVLSKASVSKQWVQKEFSSALMKQLNDRSVATIPLLREPCSIPILLVDLRYADCRSDEERGFRELAEHVNFR